MSETVLTGQAALVLEILKADLPPVTLLLGPESYLLAFGAMTGELAAHYGIGSADTYHLRAPVTAEAARTLAREAGLVPFGPFKLALILLSGASEQAQNILLKVLEEPPPTIRFLLIATEPPLPTIVSRARVFQFGVQPQEEEPDGEVQAKVASAVRAAMAGDRGLLLSACKGFEDRHLDMLTAWAQSQAARYRPELSGQAGPIEPEVDPRKARKVLQALSAVPRARPVNVAVTALSEAFD